MLLIFYLIVVGLIYSAFMEDFKRFSAFDFFSDSLFVSLFCKNCCTDLTCRNSLITSHVQLELRLNRNGNFVVFV